MADRVAVFNEGSIIQVGSPEDVYERPRTRFVADFVGGSNVIEPATTGAWIGTARAASLRPEKIALAGDTTPADAIVVEGTVGEVLYHGAMRRIEVNTAAGPLVARRQRLRRRQRNAGRPRPPRLPAFRASPDGRAVTVAAVDIGAPRDGIVRRISDVLVARHGFYLLLLLVPRCCGWASSTSLAVRVARRKLLLHRRFLRRRRPPADARHLRPAFPAGEFRRHRAHRHGLGNRHRCSRYSSLSPSPTTPRATPAAA